MNLTDGLDGLAAGAAAMIFGAFTLITFLQSRSQCLNHPAAGCYTVRDPLDLALVAASAMAACFGFLWWNASPAQIFMGDTGSLALGGLMAGLAILTRTELLLIALGGLYAAITLSSIIQTGWFKFTRIRTGTGKRVFRMAPLHHHFELGGWEQITIIVRFWILAGHRRSRSASACSTPTSSADGRRAISPVAACWSAVSAWPGRPRPRALLGAGASRGAHGDDRGPGAWPSWPPPAPAGSGR